MSDVLKRLAGPVSMAAAAASVYTVPAATVTTIRSIHVVNTTASSASFTMSIGADAAGTRLFYAYSVGPGDVFDWSGIIVMAATEILQMYASAASSLTATISGVESA